MPWAYAHTMTDKKTWQLSPFPFCGLGARAQANGVSFAVDVPESASVQLLFFEKDTKELLEELEVRADLFGGRIRSVLLEHAHLENLLYAYRIDGRVQADPAAPIVAGREIYGRKADPAELFGQVNARPYQWGGEERRPRLAHEDVIAYCLHVRGFTKQPGSGVYHKGTFRGVMEKLPYLEGLGVNQLILMPAYEFEEAEDGLFAALPEYAKLPDANSSYKPPAHEEQVEEYTQNLTQGNTNDVRAKRINFWGYKEGFYFAPKRSYCAGKAPDAEVKDLVREMHQRGMELILQFAFPDTVSMFTASQVLIWWAQEYHVDGFQIFARREVTQQLATHPQLSGVKLICGYFDRNAMPEYHHRISLADCNDGFLIDARRLLKGDENALQPFLSHRGDGSDQKAHYHYITNHDGFTLCDLVSYKHRHNEANGQNGEDGPAENFSWNCGVEGATRKPKVRALRMKQMKNALAMVLLSSGTPVLRAGDEFGNSQKGNNNPWCQDNEIGWVDWKHASAYADLTNWVKTLIQIRRLHPEISHIRQTGYGLGQEGYPAFSLHSDRAWYTEYTAQTRHIGLMYCGEQTLYVACNFHWEDKELALPHLPEGMHWECVLDSAGAQEGTTLSHHILMAPRSVCVLTSVTEGKEGNVEQSGKRSRNHHTGKGAGTSAHRSGT